VDIRDINYFLSVASTSRLNASARECGITQPALSKAIHRLEQEFGLEMFERSARGMHLTAAGRMFLVHAQRLSADMSAATQQSAELRAGRVGMLRIGATNAVVGTVVLPALTELIQKRPGMRTELSIEAADTLFEDIRAGRLDMAVAATYGAKPRDLHSTDVGSDRLVAVTRADHPLQTQKRLKIEHLVSYSWILTAQGSISREALDSAFIANTLPSPIVAIEVAFMSSDLLQVIASTDLIALAPEKLAKQAVNALRVLALPELCIARDLSIFTRHQALLSPLGHELMEKLILWAKRKHPR
jgi:DNA-binding transcriptional LysR family regulator